MAKNSFDLIIVGGGPAGATAALFAHRLGLNALLVDKAKFPRDKICGDALSGLALGIMRQLDLLDEIDTLPGMATNSVTFGSPNGSSFNVVIGSEENGGKHRGYIIRREVFDNFLFKKAADLVTTQEQFTVKDLSWKKDQVVGITGMKSGADQVQEFLAPVVIGADGFSSIISRKTGLYKHISDHWCVAVRQYFQNVDGLKDQMELHYAREIQPGYFWIFPLENGIANVGVGMLYSTMKKRGLNLIHTLNDITTRAPFAERFKNAVALDEPRGWNLPIGSTRRTCHGSGFMLIGDAAGLIDPFTGEGIGNAMISAKLSVDRAKIAYQEKNFSAEFFSEYEHELWNTVGSQMKLGTRLQRLGEWQWLLNFVVGKGKKSQQVRDTIAAMITNELPRENLVDPLFYLKLLFA